ncbi:MAG: alpha amylase family protein [Fimbriimonadales bacterium]
MIPAIAAAAIAMPAFEARVLWVDATANLSWTTSPAKVRAFCLKAKQTGFNELVVDVKPINGKWLFAGPPQERFKSFRSVAVPENYDLLSEFSKSARAAGLRISAGLNVFSEGHSYFPGVGKAYETSSWETQVAVPTYGALLADGRRVPIILDRSALLVPGQMRLATGENGKLIAGTRIRVEVASDFADTEIVGMAARTELVGQTKAFPSMVAVFVDPLTPGARGRMLSILDKVARYDIDGIVFDRLRYSALASGMGPAMRDEFAKRYGPVSAWPESVFYASPIPGEPLRHGPRFPEWMQFRAEVISEALRDFERKVKEVNPKLTVGSYVGAGWETYYEVGVNYASDSVKPPYDWALEEYGLTGYAGYLDFLMPGCFYKVAREIDPGVPTGRERFTVQGGAKLATELAGNSTFIYPALYGLDWERNPDGLRSAIRACREIGKGIMFFDTVYINNNDWWELFKQEFANAPIQPPHAMPSLRRRGGGTAD